MSHASECPNHGPVFEVEDIGCPYCDAIRKAYHHGREDAVKAMSQHLHHTELMILEACCHEAGRGGDK